jgi:hypothetical protein
MKSWVKILIGLVIIAIIGAFLGYKFMYNKPHPNYENLEADFRTAAMDLYNGFKADPAAASQKYNGKIIEISGVMSSVEAVDSLTVAVFAFEDGMFGKEGIRVTMLPKYNDDLKNYPANENIVLKGFCSGYNDTDVIIEKGSVVK